MNKYYYYNEKKEYEKNKRIGGKKYADEKLRKKAYYETMNKITKDHNKVMTSAQKKMSLEQRMELGKLRRQNGAGGNIEDYM